MTEINQNIFKNKISEAFNENMISDIFKKDIANIIEKYSIPDTIFMYDIKNLMITHPKSGYFVSEASYSSAEEFFKNTDTVDMNYAVRYTDGKFETGKWYRTLSECPDNVNIKCIL